MTARQAAALREAVAARKDILVAGRNSMGRTTLTNALLPDIVGTADRVVLTEAINHDSVALCGTRSCGVRATGGVAWVRSSGRVLPRGHECGNGVGRCG